MVGFLYPDSELSAMLNVFVADMNTIFSSTNVVTS